MFANPLVETIISRLAQDETGKRQYYRPVYSLHKWWARRPGALFRAITLLAVNGGSELFKLKEDGSISRNSVYFDSHDLKDVVILDPFKVNPHIRNKQSLDMDLVLVCQKRTESALRFSTDPQAIIRRAMNFQIVDNNPNRLFLYFMGELLRSASSPLDDDILGFEWFSNSLAHYDEYRANTDMPSDALKYEIITPKQLTFLEKRAVFREDHD
ncbi:MAG: DUF1156 domain-containing protein [Chloroflexi bacterium]|nr:DUF1156 domain-containing protein [Chloroflexota bacterium]